MWTAVITIASLALAAGALLAFASRRLPGNPDSAIEHVNRLLPQTQCAQCGYPGCELCVDPCPVDCISMETVR